MGLFEPLINGGGRHEGPLHNIVVVAPMIIKFSTGVKRDVYYTMIIKSLRRHYHYVIMTS